MTDQAMLSTFGAGDVDNLDLSLPEEGIDLEAQREVEAYAEEVAAGGWEFCTTTSHVNFWNPDGNGVYRIERTEHGWSGKEEAVPSHRKRPTISRRRSIGPASGWQRTRWSVIAMSDLSDFGVTIEETPAHDREALAEAFGVSEISIKEHEEITDAITITAPLSEIEADTRFIANSVADIGYEVLRGGENADREWFVTARPPSGGKKA